MIESCHFVIAALASVFFIGRKRSLGQGNIFAPVCHSVHRGGGVRGLPQCIPPPGPDTPRDHAPPLGHAPHPPGTREIRSTRGLYASYWNAILFHFFSEWKNSTNINKLTTRVVPNI